MTPTIITFLCGMLAATMLCLVFAWLYDRRKEEEWRCTVACIRSQEYHKGFAEGWAKHQEATRQEIVS